MKKQRILALLLAFLLLGEGNFSAINSAAYANDSFTQQNVTTITSYNSTKAQPKLDTVTELFDASTSNSPIVLQWRLKENTADGCYIYRKCTYDKSYKKIAQVNATGYDYWTFSDSNSMQGLSYQYYITPYHKINNASILGTQSSVIKISTKFNTPVLSSATRKKTTVTLKWKKIPSVSGYEIYYSSGKKYKKIKKIKSAKTLKCTVKKMSSKKTLSFKIRAYTSYNGHTVYSKYSSIKEVISSSTSVILKKIKKLKKKYPSYKYWNHVGKKNYNTSTITKKPCNHAKNGLKTCNAYPCPDHITGLQCYGFAWKMSDLIFGKNAKIKKHRSFKKAKIGDIIRYRGHSVIIIEKHSNYILVGECNIGNTCMILWGRRIDKGELSGAVYYHRY